MVVDDTRGEQVELKLSRLYRFPGPNECGGQSQNRFLGGNFSLLAQADNARRSGPLGAFGRKNFGLTLTMDSFLMETVGSIELDESLLTRRQARSALGH